MKDPLLEPHKPQFDSAPNQARKAATVEESMAAAAELRPLVGTVRATNRKRRAEIARRGKGALPPE